MCWPPSWVKILTLVHDEAAQVRWKGSMHLADLIPEVDTLVALDPEELGLRMLPLLARNSRGDRSVDLEALLDATIGNPRYASAHLLRYPIARRKEVETAVVEAWAWLEGAALLVPIRLPHEREQFHVTKRALSRKALQLAKEPDPGRAMNTRAIPREILHPVFQTDVWLSFHRGKYSTAVFDAMKAVEIAVRDAAGLTSADLGTDLMRKAFHALTGPLSDMSAEKAEREARAHLFAGAIGAYKNPHSHKKVDIDDPNEAAEVILLANHLLRIVDGRKEAGASVDAPC